MDIIGNTFLSLIIFTDDMILKPDRKVLFYISELQSPSPMGNHS
jgi:hypothetical protein